MECGSMARKGHFVFFLPSFLSFTKGTRWGTEGFHWRGWSPYLFTVVRRTCAYTRQSGITSHGCIVELWLASRQKQPLHVYTQKRSFSCVRSGETRERERRKKGTDDRGWLKWINDRRTREKYAVETEELDIVTSTFSR